jgi:geranylgeranyl diphosphate synthase type 3
MEKVELTPLEKILTEPVKYYYDMKGKEIRKIICNLIGNSLNISQEDIEIVNNLISVIHNATLVIDDIEDDSELRRKHPCAHKVYGVPMALNAGYLTIFKILTELQKQKELETVKSKIIENIYLAHMGQGMDIYYTKTKIVPSLEEYYTMIEYKTGILFITLLDILKTKEPGFDYNSMVDCVKKFSFFFQIRDDYINVTDPDYWKEKGFCQDFDEQKISFLICYAINNKLKNYEKIIKYLGKAKEHHYKIKLLRIFDESGLFDIIYNQLNDLKSQVNEIINLDIVFDILPFKKFDKNIV